jgi:crotonobetainyl-CoA:carnitine CoA-transferase CaiB-like acyl-CoA transferase
MAEAQTVDMTDPNRDPTAEPALAGLRVLEIAPPSAGPVTRYFAELGAEVIHVPQAEIVDDAIAAVLANSGKRIVRLDLATKAGLDRLADLAADADILLSTRLDGRLADPVSDAWLASVRARNPQLVAARLSPFGKGSSLESWQLTASVMDALSGVLSRSGAPGRAPLLPPGDISLQCSYVQAAWVVLVSYFNRLRTGQGDALDLSLLEGAVQCMDPGYAIGGSATAGVPASRLPRGRPESRHMYPLLPCKDGFVRICVLAPRQWQNMFRWMGEPEKYASPEYCKLQVRFACPTLMPDIAALFRDKTRAELEAEGETHGVPIAPVLTVTEAMASPQLAARGALTQITLADGRTATAPNGLLEMDGRRTAAAGAAQEERSDAGWIGGVRFAPAPAATPPARPLSGITVLDFGVIVAGAEQSRLLADQGALTLKLENKAFPDGARQSLGTEGPISINFAMGHRNKKSVGINLRDPRGKAMFLDLVRRSDIVLSNFKPGTLGSLGIDYGALSQANPAIVMGDSSAYGPTGPWSGRAGYGPLVRASSGLTAQWVYPDAPSEFSDGMTIYPDHVSGRLLAIGALALLVRRMRTGWGGTTSLAQAEVISAHLGAHIAAHSLGETRPLRPDAPWNIFPCAGDDEWVVVTVRNDADWRALASVIGREDLLAQASLATAAGRRAAQGELDAAVAAWTATRTPREAMELLQAAGVPGAKMLRVSELPEFGFYAERGILKRAGHPHIAHEFFMENAMAISERLPEPDFAPAPLLGEHTLWAASELLGLDEQTIASLVESGVLEAPEC